MTKLVSILLLAIFATQCANSVSLRRRREAATEDEQDTGVIAILQSGVGMAESLPLAGGFVEFGVTWTSDMFNALQNFTNGGFARVLGGTLPCEISTTNGIKCTGITDATNAASLLMGIMAQSPLPNFVQNIIGVLLSGALNPIVNIIFGGVPSSESQ